MTPQELKSSIIRLAMQGKLVEQRNQEGSAKQLIEAVENDRKQKTKNKTAKENKKVEPITEEVIPFDIPDSWDWIRFGNLVSYSMGKTPPRAESQWWGDDFPWVSIADMPDGGHIVETKECVSSSAISEKFSGKLSKAGTLLMSFKLTVGRVSVLDIDAVHNEAIISIYPYADYDRTIQNYLFILLPYISQYGESKNAIKGKTLNDTSISNLLIPLPPLAEQKRIVAKIEELLPYIDRYEAAWSRLEDFNKRFPVDMQKSILQMAIQGKLVEQCPEEGTGEELYQQIQAEKQRLIKAGTIKKEKPLSEIAGDEIPFDIPESWKWVKISQLAMVLNGDRGKNYPAKSTLSHTGIPFISALNLNGKSVVDDDNLLRMSEQQYERLGNGKLIKDDIVVCIRGSLGKHGRYPFERGAIASSLVILRPFFVNSVMTEFLMLYLDTPLFFSEIRKYNNGTAQPNLAAKSLEGFMFPLPPLAEQKRIIAKLEEILPLCERLK